MNRKNEHTDSYGIKLFRSKTIVALLAITAIIVAVSILWNERMQKVTVTENENLPEENTAVMSKPEETEKEYVSSEISQSIKSVDTDEENIAEKIIEYSFPVNGEVQRAFSVNNLLWDETMEDWRTHCGVDIASELGSEVDTAAEGTVTECYEDEMYGYVVKIEHPDGVVTVYKNLDKVLVKQGDALDMGQMIGTVGSGGKFESAQKAHLHFEVIVDDKYVNPSEFIK